MNQPIIKKCIVYGIIILFSGVVFFPASIADVERSRIVEQPLFHNLKRSISHYDLVIITPKIFADEVQPLVCHKKKMGLSTRLVTLDEIYREMNGRDQAEKIKYFIKAAIEEWGTKYVLLIGGKRGQTPFWYVPVRYVQMQDGWEPEYLSDLYYADIYDAHGGFSSWNADDDSRFGEWYSGKSADDFAIDLRPDVAVGRLPCRNEQEVTIVVNKIITYETKTYGSPWFTDMVVAAGDTYPVHLNPNWTGYEGEYYGDRAIENMTGFTPVRLYTSDGTLTGESDVIAALDKGCGFVYFVGHGSPKTWGNHPPDNESFVKGLTVQQMYKLWNKDMLPVCVVSGCHNCQFDVSVFRLLNKTTRYRGEGTLECWGERMTRKIGGGSIATIGCTALGYTKEDKKSFTGGINEIETAFFNAYGHQHIRTLGDTWASAVTWYVDTYPVNWSTLAGSDSWIDTKVVQSWVLFGDPSLQIGGYL